MASYIGVMEELFATAQKTVQDRSQNILADKPRAEIEERYQAERRHYRDHGCLPPPPLNRPGFR